MLCLSELIYASITKLHFMEFKFDTKPTYTVITPVADTLDENLTGELLTKLRETASESANNFILDLQNCTKADNTSPEALTSIHEWCYENQSSFVITGVQPGVKEILMHDSLETSLNIAPTMIEAVDIVSMEILERDLMAEDGDWGDEA